MDKEDQIKEVLNIVAQKYNIKIWRYAKKPISGDIKNFMANLSTICLVDEDKGESFDIYIKIAPEIDLQCLQDMVTVYYDHEVYFYNTFLPILQNNTDINLEGLIPKCYYAESHNKKVVVLKDMCVDGFKRYEYGMFLDREHSIVSLQGIAKFHALSMIVKDKNLELPNIEIFKPDFSNSIVSLCECIRFLLNKYLYLFEGSQCERVLRSLARYINNSDDFYNECKTKAKCLVYGHGDLWIENILFKYSGIKPIEVCFVDYQFTRLMSPATEFLRFIMDNTESSVRRHNYKTYSSTYYQSLQLILRSQGVDLQKLYAEDDFNSDLLLTFPYCFGMSFLSFLMWLQQENPVSILKKDMTLPQDLQNKNIVTFKKVVENLIKDFQYLGLCENFMM